jgi:RNA polymerase-binding transcription factor DksA
MALVVSEEAVAAPTPAVADAMRPALPRREAEVIRRRLTEQVLTHSEALHAAQVRLQPMLDACSLEAPWPSEVATAFEHLDATLTRLAAASEALDRFDAGLYGECEGCAQPVPALRLLADPTAARCPSCA